MTFFMLISWNRRKKNLFVFCGRMPSLVAEFCCEPNKAKEKIKLQKSNLFFSLCRQFCGHSFCWTCVCAFIQFNITIWYSEKADYNAIIDDWPENGKTSEKYHLQWGWQFAHPLKSTHAAVNVQSFLIQKANLSVLFMTVLQSDLQDDDFSTFFME